MLSPLWITALAVSSTAQAPATHGSVCAVPDVVLHGGLIVDDGSTGAKTVDAAAQIAAGWELEPCLALPLRSEVQLSSSLRGPPWGDGTSVVRVGTWISDIAVAGGSRYVILRSEDATHALGVEGLAGPGLRFIRQAIDLGGQLDAVFVVQPELRLSAGMFSQHGPLRLAFRTSWSVPGDRGVTVTLGIGIGPRPDLPDS